MRAPAALAALLALLVPRGAGAGLPDCDPPPQGTLPSLVLVITVDQMRGDYLDRFGAQLTGGLARIAQGGAVFTHAYQDHGVPETAPGHATLLSGRHPSSTGIVRNDAGVPDPTAPLLETGGPGASPHRFRGTTLLDWMQRRWSGTKGFSVARKDRSAILPFGRSRQPTFWYDSGIFTTSSWYAEALPDWVVAFNDAMAAARTPGRVWDLMLPAARYTEPDSMPYENFGRDYVYPHRMPVDSAAARRAFVDYPWIDSLTLALALEGIQQLQLGRGRTPDLVHIGLSQTDRMGHAFGPDSRELHDHILRVDRWLGAFLDSLGRLRDPGRIVLVLTADHGVASFPEWAQTHGHPDYDYVNVDTVINRYRAAIRAQVADSAFLPFPYREYGLLTMDRTGLSWRHLNGDSIVAALRADLVRIPGVLRVDTRRTIERADTAADAVARRWQHMLPPDLDVGVLITLREGNIFAPGRGNARHGQLSDEGSHVTLVFYGMGIRPGRHEGRVSTVDIGPTLAALIAVRPTERVQGRVLREALQ